MGVSLYKVTKVEVRGRDLAFRRAEIDRLQQLEKAMSGPYRRKSGISEMIRGQIKELRRKGVGAYIHGEFNGQKGTVKVRINDLPPEVLGHVLLPVRGEHGYSEEHVRRTDVAAAEILLRKLIESGKDVMQGFVPTEEKPIDWATLPFDLNPSKAMFFLRLRGRNKQGQAVAHWDSIPLDELGQHMYPYGSLPISPGAVVLNYGQGGFEGIKAYRTIDGKLVIFRCRENVKRWQRTANRLEMIPASEEFYLRAIRETVLANAEFIPPPGFGASLYIRPLQFGIGAGLGVKAAKQEAIVIFVSPVGAYFKKKFAPIKLATRTDYHRAAPGMYGDVKGIGLYAGGLLPKHLVTAAKLDEILWLDISNQYVEEAGTANFFCVKNGVLHTPHLSGTILPGVTRDSVIQMARAFGLKVEEEKVSIDFALQTDEAFCTGTAAVICPVGAITHNDEERVLNSGEPGPITVKLYKALVAIQEGRFDAPELQGINPDKLAEIKEEWLYPLEETA